MKLIAIAAAAAIGLLPVEASAAPQTTVTTVKHNRNGTTTRTVVSRSARSARGGWHWQTKCKTWYHHGRQYKSCKKARIRW